MTWFELSRVKLYRNELRGNKNYFELAGGSSYRGQNYSKCKMEIQGKSTLVRVRARFELARVRVIGSQLYLSCLIIEATLSLICRKNPFVYASYTHSFEILKQSFKFRLKYWLFIELELQLTKIYHTSPPPFFFCFCSVCNP